MIQLSREQRETLVHEQVRKFAAAGWVRGATGTSHGIKWRWYREGAEDYVIAGVVIAEHRADLVDYVGPEIEERFSPAEVRRICAMGGPSAVP